VDDQFLLCPSNCPFFTNVQNSFKSLVRPAERPANINHQAGRTLGESSDEAPLLHPYYWSGTGRFSRVPVWTEFVLILLGFQRHFRLPTLPARQ
jgi:hypothetical protein